MTWSEWSHEVKNRLTVIRVNSQLWQREVKGESRYLDKILAEVDKIVELLAKKPGRE